MTSAGPGREEFLRKHAVILLMLVGCSDATAPSPPFDLEVRVTPAAAAAFAGRALAVALVDVARDSVIARRTATLDADGIEFVFRDVLRPGLGHELLYWVDANDGGGETGACDAPAVDPQGLVPIDPAPVDLWVEFGNLAGNPSTVCDGFTVDLTVTGASGFATDHAGDDIVVRLIDAATDAVSGQHLGQIAGTGVPFTVDFARRMVVGRTYELEVWVDSNTGGGTPGVCDDPPVDRQWRIPLGTAGEQDVVHTVPLDTGAMTQVCPV